MQDKTRNESLLEYNIIKRSAVIERRAMTAFDACATGRREGTEGKANLAVVQVKWNIMRPGGVSVGLIVQHSKSTREASLEPM